MPVNEMNDFVLAMDKIEAREFLLHIQAVSFPKMEKTKRTKLFDHFKRASELEEKELDSFEIAKALGFV